LGDFFVDFFCFFFKTLLIRIFCKHFIDVQNIAYTLFFVVCRELNSETTQDYICKILMKYKVSKNTFKDCGLAFWLKFNSRRKKKFLLNNTG